MIDRARWLYTPSAGLRAASAKLQGESRALRALYPRRKKPLAKILGKIRPLICLACGRGDHQDCSGVGYVDPQRLSRRAPCTCAATKHSIKRSA